MKPDKLDIKIQEAAAQNEAAYDEQAWAAMEKLLDKEMPQKKKDNKKIFWWFLLLCIVIAGLWLIISPGEKQKAAIIPEKTNTAAQSAVGADQTLKDQKTTATQNENQDIASNERPQSEQKKSVSEKKSAIIFSTNHSNKKSTGSEKENSSGKNSITKIDNNSYSYTQSPDKKKITEPTNESKVSVEGTEPGKSVADENSMAIADSKNDSTIDKQNSQDSAKKNKAPRNKNKFGNSFLVSVSAGPDISAVSLNDPGKIEFLYGAGIGYKINKRLTVRTGFYIVKKGYGAKTSDYHPPAGFWNYYPDLQSIDAICKIYEVPLIINYNFSVTPNHTWFASAGLSSYFMKKEDYSYISKSPTGQTSYHDYTVRNENQHYFSSVRLSAGYEKKVSDKISFTAEPYLSLPVSGIGYGKVKLYGAGVLFSLNIKPFSKK